MTVVAVIPARYAAVRFPGKPLANKTGKFLIQHVYENVARARRIDRVIVATDDDRIESAVQSFGGEVRRTRSDHQSGTDRVGEVAAALRCPDDDIVLNVQGDEPEVSAEVLDRVVEELAGSSAGCSIVTPAARFGPDAPTAGPGSPLDPNCVKVVVTDSGRALYFSRSLIPYPRETKGQVDDPSRWLLHLGVYGFRADMLRRVCGLDRAKASSLEQFESLEQLRWLAAGLAIGVVLVAHRFAGIDTPEQYAAFAERYIRPGPVKRTCAD